MRYRNFIGALVLVCLSICLSGCSTMADARLAKGTGTKQSFQATYDSTWDAVTCSFNGLGLSIAGENKEDGYLLGQRGITAFSYGENVVAFLMVVDKKQTEVEIVSKRVMQTNVFAPDWTSKVLQGVSACLKS